jgi:D-alanyl-D-alanine carboxypeptidase (penicillin-binding protein 5/6)
MRRTLIIVAVTLLHVILLVWFLSCRSTPLERQPSESSRDFADGHTPAAVAAGQSDNATAAETTPPADAPRTALNTVPPLSHITFETGSKPLPGNLQAATGKCRTGLLVDWKARRILWSKDASKPVPIASMTKMMTVLMMMEHIEADPLLTLDTPVQVTRTAAAVGGRQVWLDPRETFPLRELLKCILIRSANDTAYLTAEFLSSGKVGRFVDEMNQRAAALGLTQAHFVSPHGLPPEQNTRPDQASALELAYLAGRLLDYPEVTKWSSMRLAYIRENSEQFDRFQLVNSNGLVEKVPGVNGMKTGYTKEAGYCTTVTCNRNGRILIAVATGCSSANERDETIRQLLEWGYLQ